MNNQEYVRRINTQQSGLFHKRKPFLTQLDIELTERCNNNCVHCYINLPENCEKSKKKELSTSQWKEIIKESSELGTLSIRFTGGEPLLRDDFIDLYLFTRSLGIKVVLFTNARLITKELAELLRKIPPLEKIEVSIYGMHPETNRQITSSNSGFNETQRGLQLLLQHQVPFVVKSVLLPVNKTELSEYMNFAASLPYMDKTPSYTSLLILRARRDSQLKNDRINSLRLSPEEYLSIITRDENLYRKSMKEFCSKSLFPKGQMLFTCGAGKASCVDAYGFLQMCLLLRHPDTVFDVKNGSLRDGIANFFPKIYNTVATNPEYLRRCAQCFLRGLCEQCPAHSWIENGTLDTPVEYLCQIAHSQAYFLGLLDMGEYSWEIQNWQERISRLI